MIIINLRFTCDYCIPCLKVSGPDLGWKIVMMLGPPFGYLLGGSIGMFLGLKLVN